VAALGLHVLSDLFLFFVDLNFTPMQNEQHWGHRSSEWWMLRVPKGDKEVEAGNRQDWSFRN
jgi:hypothetical protein